MVEAELSFITTLDDLMLVRIVTFHSITLRLEPVVLLLFRTITCMLVNFYSFETEIII